PSDPLPLVAFVQELIGIRIRRYPHDLWVTIRPKGRGLHSSLGQSDRHLSTLVDLLPIEALHLIRKAC
ncbi:hypothetical protein, partial [Deinococcus ruber]|uniref:hypothetical protein n=1 Tax=Deinococcus ruber TaxID=1848197 RepID=UPI001E2BFF8A